MKKSFLVLLAAISVLATVVIVAPASVAAAAAGLVDSRGCERLFVDIVENADGQCEDADGNVLPRSRLTTCPEGFTIVVMSNYPVGCEETTGPSSIYYSYAVCPDPTTYSFNGEFSTCITSDPTLGVQLVQLLGCPTGYAVTPAYGLDIFDGAKACEVIKPVTVSASVFGEPAFTPSPGAITPVATDDLACPIDRFFVELLSTVGTCYDDIGEPAEPVPVVVYTCPSDIGSQRRGACDYPGYRTLSVLFPVCWDPQSTMTVSGRTVTCTTSAGTPTDVAFGTTISCPAGSEFSELGPWCTDIEPVGVLAASVFVFSVDGAPGPSATESFECPFTGARSPDGSGCSDPSGATVSAVPIVSLICPAGYGATVEASCEVQTRPTTAIMRPYCKNAEATMLIEGRTVSCIDADGTAIAVELGVSIECPAGLAVIFIDGVDTCAAPLCQGQIATVLIGFGETATSGNDVIVGTEGNDEISGLGGDDIICGLGGDDTIFGGEGNDRIYGDPGKDRIRGQNGNDTINGGDGNDNLNGNNGNDTVNGGAGNDYVSGRDGKDTVTGGPGNDTVNGGGKQDVLRGGPGDDIINGNGFADNIWGGTGNDTINGGDGPDHLRGERGNDTLYGGRGNDTLWGGNGTDTCDGKTGYDTQINCQTTHNIP